jgi:FkbM family methyltransferase
MPPEAGGLWFSCALRDSIAREVCFTGQYEPQETALLRHLLKEGMTFVDVGANWGYFTLFAARLIGPGGRGVALEPDPRLFRLLESNRARNHLSWVSAHQVAAADRPGRVRLAGFDERAGNWGLSRLAPPSAEGCFAVDAVEVDAFLDSLGVGDVDLIKIDIEGAEDLALRGMSVGLSRARYKRLLLELHPTLLAERGVKAEEVVGRLSELGYRPWSIDHSPAVTRQIAYAHSVSPGSFLRPGTTPATADAWPHMLWLSPSLDSPAP